MGDALEREIGDQSTLTTGGGVHVRSRIDGLFSLGQYMRSIGRRTPSGAGSQLASLSLPGDSPWKYNVSEPFDEPPPVSSRQGLYRVFASP